MAHPEALLVCTTERASFHVDFMSVASTGACLVIHAVESRWKIRVTALLMESSEALWNWTTALRRRLKAGDDLQDPALAAEVARKGG